MLRALLVLLAVAVVIAGVAAYVWLYPYVAPPPEPPEVIAARWAAVEGWAREPGGYEGDPAALRRALDHLSKSSLRGFNPADDAPTGGVALDDEARAALRELVRWGDEGGLGAELCSGDLRGDRLPAFQLFTLSRLAIAVADDPDALELSATLRLGDALRSRGDLLLATVGFAIANHARERADRETWPLGQGFVDHRPRREQAFPALAREAFCAEATVLAVVRDEGQGDEVIGVAGLDRELAMLRWYEGRRLTDLERLRGDLPALAQALRAPPERPASLLVQAMSPGLAVFDDLEQVFVDYERYLARAE